MHASHLRDATCETMRPAAHTTSPPPEAWPAHRAADPWRKWGASAILQKSAEVVRLLLQSWPCYLGDGLPPTFGLDVLLKQTHEKTDT